MISSNFAVHVTSLVLALSVTLQFVCSYRNGLPLSPNEDDDDDDYDDLNDVENKNEVRTFY